MNNNQKLIELLMQKGFGLEGASVAAEHLIVNGVTVRDNGKPLDSFQHPVDAYNGLKEKFLVFKADTGEKVENCFVLRPDKDSAAVAALRAYAEATENDTLANDIYNWVGKDNNAPSKWIPATERLPNEKKVIDGETYFKNVAVRVKGVEFEKIAYYDDALECWCDTDFFPITREVTGEVTHWTPLPEPPKEGKDNA